MSLTLHLIMNKSITSNQEIDREVKRFLFLGNGWFPVCPGGQERYLYELTCQLIQEKNWVDLLAFGIPSSTELNSHLRLISLGQPNAPLWKRFVTIRKRFSEREAFKEDAINLHFPLCSFPLLSQLPTNIPVTLTFHGPWALESLQEGESRISVFLKYCLEKRVYQRCDRFIVLSDAFGMILHDNYQVPWEKIHVIPGGVDLKRFQLNLSRQEARAKLNWPQDRLILFTPRRLVHRMGIDKLLTALAQTRSEISEVWLAIAGKGPLRVALEHQVEELNLSNHVKFLGYLPDEQLPIAYQAADLTVIPSQALEGFGLVLLESLACGTPAICTPVGGMPEVIKPFAPECITDSIDADAIREKLESFLNGDLSLPSRMDCRKYAETNYSWLNIAPRVREVLLA